MSGVRQTGEGRKRSVSSFFKVEAKEFRIKSDELSVTEAILITEKVRDRWFHLSIEKGCATWMVRQIAGLLEGRSESWVRIFRGENFQVWLETAKNKWGGFLRVSKCLNGVVKTVLIPQGRRQEGWRMFKDNVVAFINGMRENVEIAGSGNGVTLPPSSSGHYTYKEALHSAASVGSVVKETGAEKDDPNWSWVVVCERQVVYQPWDDIRSLIGSCLRRDIDLFPYQCNRAFFKCNSKEEALAVGGLRKLTIDGQPEVLLFSWEQGLKNNITKVVSYGGWIAILGLPMHWWAGSFFQRIGDACGGLIEVAENTKRFRYLYQAKIRVKHNDIGFLPEMLKLTEGQETYYVQIRSISPAVRRRSVGEVGRRRAGTESLCPRSIADGMERGGSQMIDVTSLVNTRQGPLGGGAGVPVEETAVATLLPNRHGGSQLVQRERMEEALTLGSGKFGQVQHRSETLNADSCAGGVNFVADDEPRVGQDVVNRTRCEGTIEKVGSDALIWAGEDGHKVVVGPKIGSGQNEFFGPYKKDFVPTLSWPNQDKQSSKGSFYKKFGERKGGGTNVAVSYLAHKRNLIGADRKMENLLITENLREDDPSGSFSSWSPNSMNSAETESDAESQMVEDIHSCEEKARSEEYEGEDGALGRLFAQTAVSTMGSESEHEKQNESDLQKEPRLIQYKRRGKRGNRGKEGMQESKKILSLLDVSVVPLKRRLFGGRRGGVSKTENGGGQGKCAGQGEGVKVKGAAKSF